MPFDFATAKVKVRRAVHDTLGVSATYSDSSVSDEPVRVRWHNKIDRFGDDENQGNAEIILGIDRIILIPSDTPDLTFQHGGIVTLAAPLSGSFRLDVKEPGTGPLEEAWLVVLQ